MLTIAIVLILHNRSSPDSASVGDAPTPATPSAFSATTQPDDDSSKSSRPALSASPSADASHPPPSDVHLSPQVLFAQASPSVGRMDHLDSRGRPVAFGTGFFVSADGLVVTNYHVLEGASGARFVLDESREFPVEGFVAADHGHDLMLVKVKAAGVPYLRVWAGDPPPVGAQIYAIGNPEGLSNTLSNGLVSGIRKDGSEVAQIQINAAITHGSSGGPLLTESGLVVGVTSSGMGEANLNFAIPSRQVDRLIHSAGAVHSIADLGKMQTDAEAARIVLLAMQLTSGGHPAEALAVLDNVITDKRENWRYWFAKGLAHEAQGMSVLGEFDFKNAQRLGPDIASAWETIGAAYMNKDKPDSAAECFTKALDRDPFSIPAYAGLAQADIKAGKASDAVAVCTRGLAKTGDNAELLDILGQCYIATKDPESATKTFEQAVKIDSRNSRALIDLGLAYKSAGRAKEARETLNKVFSSDTDARVLEKQAARKALNSLEEGPQ